MHVRVYVQSHCFVIIDSSGLVLATLFYYSYYKILIYLDTYLFVYCRVYEKKYIIIHLKKPDSEPVNQWFDR